MTEENMGGIFDQKPTENIKEDFKSPFEEQANQINDRVDANRKPVNEILNQEDAAGEAAANALNNQGPSGGSNVQADLDEMDKISDEDLKLAEELIFKGYAEFDASMPNLPNVKLTICSTSAEEMGMIDEIAFDMVKEADELKDGNLDMPQNRITTMRNALYVALSYRGRNGVELMEDNRAHLNTLKKAIRKISDYYNAGKMKEGDELKVSVKQALTARAIAVNRMPTTMIDYLSGQKFEFDEKVAMIMKTDKILPKS